MDHRKWLGLSTIFSYIAGFEMIFVLLSYFQTGRVMEIGMLPWILWMFGLYLFQLLLLKRGITVQKFLFASLIFALFCLISMNLFFMKVDGFLPHLIASLLIGVTIIAMEEISRNGLKSNQILMQLELMVLLFGVILFLQESHVAPDFSGKAYMMLAILFNLCALIFSRTSSVHMSGKANGSAWQGILLLACMLGLLFLAGIAFVLACSESGRIYLKWMVGKISQLLLLTLNMLTQGIVFFLNLFPDIDGSGSMNFADPISKNTVQSAQMELETPGIFQWIFFIALVLMMGALIFLLWKKFRKYILKEERLGGWKEEKVIRKKASFWQQIKIIWHRLRFRLFLRWKLLTAPDQAGSVLLRAEALGRKYHIPRQPEESPGAYLRRLAGSEQITSSKVRERLLEEAEFLEVSFYGATELSHGTMCLAPCDAEGAKRL